MRRFSLTGRADLTPVREARVIEIKATRRRLLAWASNAIGALIGASIAVPGLGYLLTPVLDRRSRSERVPIGKIADLTSRGVPTKKVFEYDEQDGYRVRRRKGFAWVVRGEDDDVIVFSAQCTHLGCNVAWNEAEQQFRCPCHGGRFDRQGNVVGGPPMRPLDRFDVEIAGGEMTIDVG